MTCNLHDRVDDIIRRMTEGRLRHLPVVADERLIGVVSIRDVVELRFNEMKQDSDALREYAGSKSRARQYELQDNAHLAQAQGNRGYCPN
jgi:Mg/Co/Ni transporter MgtE